MHIIDSKIVEKVIHDNDNLTILYNTNQSFRRFVDKLSVDIYPTEEDKCRFILNAFSETLSTIKMQTDSIYGYMMSNNIKK